MSRSRRRRKGTDAVSLNLAAMLDMAFQLLAFFVLTFRPAPIEGHLQVHMPPPIPVTKVNTEPASGGQGDNNMSSGLETLDLYITSDKNGDVSEIKVGTFSVVRSPLNIGALQKLNAHLKSIFEIDEILFDRVQLHTDGRLRYEELMKIIDICTRQILPDGTPMQRVNFMEL